VSPGSFVRNTAVLLFGHLGVVILNIGTGVFLARGLGPEGRGAYLAVALWPQVLGWCASLGLARATAYHRARSAHSGRALAANAVLVSLVAGVMVVLGVEAVLPRLLHQYTADVVTLGRGVLLLTPVFALTDILQGFLQGAGRFRMLAACRILTPLVQIVGFGLLVGTGRMSVGSAALVFGVSNIALVLFQLSVLPVETGSPFRPHAGLFRESASYALRLYPAFIADVAIMSLDQALLIPVLAASDLGYYAVATRAMLLAQVPIAASQVLFSTVSALPIAHGMTLAKRVFFATLGVTAILGAVAWFLASFLIEALFGGWFLPAVAPFRVSLAGAFAMGAARIIGETLSGVGKPHYVSVSQVTTLGVMATLLWALVPRWHMMGAVWAVTTAQWVNLALIGALLCRLRMQPRTTAAA
jgi:O-antigen/teichoic acid export membrane protein